MADVMEPPAKEATDKATKMTAEPERIDEVQDGKIRIDGDFLKEQASEAVATFFAPLMGVYAAIRGDRIVLRRRRRQRRKAA